MKCSKNPPGHGMALFHCSALRYHQDNAFVSRKIMYPLLLETDQIHCYDTAGKRIDCMGSGPGSEQDAARSKHLPPAADRFQIQGDLVRDRLSGALWARNANPADFPLNWEEAHALAADMAAHKAHGCADWQLPPRRLLFSLLSHQYINPALPEGHPFTNVFSGYYWTADTCHRLPEQAWHIHLGGGRVTRVRKDEAALVWPVCLPKTEDAAPLFSPGERFALDGDSVRDQLTGLIWSRNADPLGRPLPWEEALAAVDGLNRAAQDRATDWRMPNIRELESLVDLQADSPALPEGHPFTNVRDVYWSSTTSVYEARYAWALYSRDGMVGVGFKPDTGFHLWPVRGKC